MAQNTFLPLAMFYCVTVVPAQLESDEYANRIPNPKRMPKYTKAKVLHTPS